MEFLVLGPIEVRSAGGPIRVGGVKQRSILALLIANRGRAVSTDRIVEDIYGEDAAPGARRSVQSLVSLLRRELGDVIAGSGAGYVFDVPREAVDAARFEDGVAAGLEVLADDPMRAAALLREALGLWRGDPYPDVDGRAVFEPEIVRLAELRLTAIEARIEADLACGRHREVLGELEALTVEYPQREGLWGLWMLALYRVGRQAEALGAYQTLRTALGEGLGIEPSSDLRALEEQILLHDPELDLVSPVPHNLPASLTSFVGRDLELIEVGDLLASNPLVTLSGAGGSGKTRLAVELARDVLDDYPDGVWFVDFRGVDSAGVASLLVSTLRVITAGDRPLADQLVDALRHRRLLLVLDNCEHVLDGVAPLVERLVARDGAIRVLATSREPLGVPGESVMLVRPLPVPDSERLSDLVACDAAVMFADRARNVDAEFTLGKHARAAFGICRAVEGLPLALELAAARLRVFSPEELADRLDNQLAVLKATQRAGDLRHATMEATIRWSWDLLDNAERVLFARLSVFRGTWSVSAAEPMCGFDPIDVGSVFDLLGRLVEKSLITVERVVAGSTRYRLLEPIRQFAARQLDDRATRHLQDRLVDYWSAELAVVSQPTDRFGERDFGLAWGLEVDQANLTAAVESALVSGRDEDAMRIFASPFGDLLAMQGSAFNLAAGWLERVLERGQTVMRETMLSALGIVCTIANADYRNKECVDYTELAVEMCKTSEERTWFELHAALATDRLGRHDAATTMFDRIIANADRPSMRASALLAKAQFELPSKAWALAQQAMELAPIDALGWWDESVAVWLVGVTAAGSGRYHIAARMEERSLELSRFTGWLVMEAHAAAVLCRIYTATGRIDEAAAVIAEAVSMVRRILGPNITSFSVLLRAADVSRLRGDIDAASRYVEEARRAAERVDIQRFGVGASTYQAALIARDTQDYDRARELVDRLPHRLGGSSEDFDDWSSPPTVANARASIELRGGNLGGVLRHVREVLAEPERLSHFDGLEAVDLAAIAFALGGEVTLAARLKGAVDREREDAGLVIQPPDAPFREAAMQHAQSVYDGDWDAAVTQGRTLAFGDAIELARIETASSGVARTGVSPQDN